MRLVIKRALRKDIIKTVIEQVRRCINTFLHYVTLYLLLLQTELRDNGNYHSSRI